MNNRPGQGHSDATPSAHGREHSRFPALVALRRGPPEDRGAVPRLTRPRVTLREIEFSHIDQTSKQARTLWRVTGPAQTPGPLSDSGGESMLANHLQLLPSSIVVLAATVGVPGAVAITRSVVHYLTWRQAISKASARDLPAITANMAASEGAVREGNRAPQWRAGRAARTSVVLLASFAVLTLVALLRAGGHHQEIVRAFSSSAPGQPRLLRSR
jgi:hypothetical protein